MEYFKKKEEPRLVKGRDFYEQGDLVIFTERFHRARGYCCKSDCRHCPYRSDEVPPAVAPSIIRSA